MKTIIVSDEVMEMTSLQCMIGHFQGIKITGTFAGSESALWYAQNHRVELAIIRIEMKDMNGIILGKQLRKINPDILFIFISELERYAMEALRLHAVAFLIQPCTKEELLYALESARLLSKRRKKRIFAKTFGHFDIFVDEQPIMFRSGKAKELLALLVDRQGGTVSTDQIICTLWEERPNDEATQNLCSKVSRSLQKELKEYGVQELLITNRGIRRVNTELFECDLYEFLAGDERAKRRFSGEYMSDYSWAEERIGQLLRYTSE